MSEDVFAGRIGLQQRVLPAYRAPFFDLLAGRIAGGLQVFAGRPHPSEAITTTEQLRIASYVPARNRHLFRVTHPLYLCWQGGFQEWLSAWDPDVLIAEANPRYPVTRQAMRWMQSRGRPVVGWGLGAPPMPGWFGDIRRAGRVRFLQRFQALIAYSQRGAQEYRQMGIPAERINVATNAAAARPLEPPPKRPLTFEGPPTAIFVGRLQARKRVDDLLRACAALPESIQPDLWIVGDGPARAQFEILAGAVYPRAVFHGERRGEALTPLLRQADLFVLPGTGGLAVQQAMAHGLPVIVAQGDGTQDDLVRPENGWRLPPRDLYALTATLQKALSDPARLRRMGAASYRIVDQEINLEAMVETFISVLKRL